MQIELHLFRESVRIELSIQAGFSVSMDRGKAGWCLLVQQAELHISSDQDEAVIVVGAGAGVVVTGVGTVVYFYLVVRSVGSVFVVRIHAFLRFVCTNHRPSPPHRMSH